MPKTNNLLKPPPPDRKIEMYIAVRSIKKGWRVFEAVGGGFIDILSYRSIFRVKPAPTNQSILNYLFPHSQLPIPNSQSFKIIPIAQKKLSITA
ncbi:hypothetical protein QUB63_12885 [Microcoleus sp. ARI1-B5]|uniref:hypothetical protein n=1 Tax=unclassified Microcoleus TaxID=2642155 RepID=UPI002FD08FF8